MRHIHISRTRFLPALLFALPLLGSLTTFAQGSGEDEYADCYETVHQAGPLQYNVPLDCAAGYSKMEMIVNYGDFYSLCDGDVIHGLAFNGCNSGAVQQRHLEVWVEENYGGLPTSEFTPFKYMKKIADGLFTVKSGGTETSPERILEIPFDTSFVCNLNLILRFTIVCRDAMPGSAVGFVSASNLFNNSVLCASGSDESAFSQPSKASKPQLTLMVRRPVHYVSGTVSDEDGHGIADATVMLRSYPSGRPDLAGTTDSDGHYRIRTEDGNCQYIAYVTAAGHTILDDHNVFSVTDNPVNDYTLYGSVTYPAGVRSTVILPFAPDPTVGRYYTLAHREGRKVVFGRVMEPQANHPYVLFADRDYHVSLEGYDLTAIVPGSVSYDMVSFDGTYTDGYGSFAIASKDPFSLDDSTTTGNAMHAMLWLHYSISRHHELEFVDQPVEQLQARPLLVDGRTWTYACGNVTDGYHAYRQTVKGDTVIGGQTWKQVWREDPIGSTPYYEKAMRQHGQRVYYLTEDRSDRLFMDFGAGPRELFDYPDDALGVIWFLVAADAERVTLADGSEARRVMLKQLYSYPLDLEHTDLSDPSTQWTECLGGDLGIDKAVLWSNDTGQEHCLLSCRDGAQVLFEDVELAERLGIDINSGITLITKKPHGSTLFDLQGRRLIGKPASGLYIEGGRKHVMR